MTRELREFVRTRENRRCGYCGVTESSVGGMLTIDHFRPAIHGGGDEPENLVYCCHSCNSFKGDYWNEVPEQRLLSPRFDVMSEHVLLTDSGTLKPLSQRGVLHIRILHLNRDALVDHRFELAQMEATRERQKLLIAQIDEAEQKIVELQRRIRALMS